MIVAAFGTLAAFRSLEQIRAQAKSTEEAARAAQKSADAVMVGQRAWMLVEGVRCDRDLLLQPAPSFSFLVNNYGQTLGRMRSFKAGIQISEHRECPDDLVIFEQDGATMEDTVITPRGEPLRLDTRDRWPPFSVTLSQEERDRINTSSLFLWACGCIFYYDIFSSQIHESRFAYAYDPMTHELCRATFPGLNRTT